ncbi:MAG: Fur family transcriptional regulator [Prevotellaceae bacterium]|nr:transcriptional repressor [Prevotella sp.]MDD7257031.1 Fur family transcriptional regulator [Prevotellaceae bacterium]
MQQTKDKAYERLVQCGIRPSVQRIEIMNYLMTHFTHPTVETVYQGLISQVPTLSRTTVYNTLRLFTEHNAAQMITIDEHRVCYDGDTHPHVHFYCKHCGKVIDFMDEPSPVMDLPKMIEGNFVDETQLYYKGICADCRKGKSSN